MNLRLCRAVLPGAHRHSGGEIGDRDRNVIHRGDSQLRQPDWTAKTDDFSPGAYSSPFPSRPFAVLLVLTARFFTCRSNHSPPPIPYSWFPVDASLRLYKPAS